MNKKSTPLDEICRVANVAFWSWQFQKKKLVFSDQLYEIFKIKKQNSEPTLEDWIASIHIKDRKKVRQVIKEAFEKKQPYSIVYRFELSPTRIRYISEKGRVFFKKNRPHKMFSIIQDVTEKEEKRRIISTLR